MIDVTIPISIFSQHPKVHVCIGQNAFEYMYVIEWNIYITLLQGIYLEAHSALTYSQLVMLNGITNENVRTISNTKHSEQKETPVADHVNSRNQSPTQRTIDHVSVDCIQTPVTTVEDTPMAQCLGRPPPKPKYSVILAAYTVRMAQTLPYTQSGRMDQA